MKLMKRMLLIHWHYFVHEMIEFDKLNFLTGKNSSGKSTIIDAMQLLLFGDTSGSFFNKAASGRGTRTLTSYLRGELGDDEDSGFRYLRDGRFTSYIVIEFYDEKTKDSFTAGCCFDTFGENDWQRQFFRFDGQIPENEFLVQGVPLSIEGLRALIRANHAEGHRYTTNVGRDFKEDLCGRLGGLQPKRFTELLKKAVSFNPNVDIQQFITDFVCGEEQKIDVSGMQENIRSYDILKKESSVLQDRISLLAKIGETYVEFVRHSEQEMLYSYLIERSAFEINEYELETARQDARRFMDDLASLEEELEKADAAHKQLQGERDSLKLQLDSNENARRLEDIQKQIEEKIRSKAEIQDRFERLSALLHNTIASWKSYIARVNEKISGIDLSGLDPVLHERIEALLAEGKELFKSAELLIGGGEKAKADGEKLTVLSNEADSYRDRCRGLFERLCDAQNETAHSLSELKREKESLEEGIYRFPQDAVDLKEAIDSRLRSRFGPEARAVIFAEAAEVKGDRWRDAIEGYMNEQKFYIIVAPEYFDTAFQLYDSLRQRKSLYATGLVDTEKLKDMNPVREDGSLAEELDTEDPAVRLFIDYILGRIRKSDTVRNLRKTEAAGTDEGVIYQNLAVHAMDPKLWRNPAIGRGGMKLRLGAVIAEIERLSHELSVFAGLISALHETDGILRLSGYETEQIVDAAKCYRELPELEETIARLEADAESIDRREIETLLRRLSERERSIDDISALVRRLVDKRGGVSEKLRALNEEKIPGYEAKARTLEDMLESEYDKDWISETGEVRYLRELSARGSADEIYNAFPREQSRSRNAKEAAWDEIRDSRRRYNEVYKMGYDPETPDNDIYNQALQDYSENKLPEYEAKIEDTRRKAFQQFQEDFLSRLQSNIFNAKRQIDDLNSAIRGASFGEDTYRFRIIAKPEYKRYYDMIVDEMLLTGGYNLLSEQFNAKYKEEIAELFAIITNDSGTQSAYSHEDYEKRVQVFTDYKTYLDFDLEVIKPGGESERLSKTIGKKSGGETQTPFYIAVLASFVQLYRVGRDKTPNTARLILFDEAFSKMDGERIIQSIELLRRFDFQVVLAAPPDKIPDIAALVDRNLCVLREGRKICVRAFDPRELEESMNEQ